MIEMETTESLKPSLLERTSLPSRDKLIPVGHFAAIAYAIGSTVVIAILPEPFGNDFINYIFIAVLFGLLFGHTTSASIWASLGTGPHWLRIALVLSWVFVLVVATAILFLRTNGPPDDVAIVVGSSMVAQTLAIQIPLWILRFTNGLRLAAPQERATLVSERIQFGIFHMMVFTAMIAVTLGAAQSLINWLGIDSPGPGFAFALFLYLALSAMLVSIPIALATLVDRPIACLLAATFGLIVTGLEYPVMQVVGLRDSGPDIFHIASINFAAAIVALVYCLGLRYFGFRLTLGRAAQLSQVREGTGTSPGP